MKTGGYCTVTTILHPKYVYLEFDSILIYGGWLKTEVRGFQFQSEIFLTWFSMTLGLTTTNVHQLRKHICITKLYTIKDKM